MKKIFITIILYSLFLILPGSVRAAGDLTIDWGIPEPFNVQGMLPGDPPSEKDISITNDGSVSRVVAIKGELVEEEKNFSEILDIEITKDAVFFYGGPGDPKKLKDFLDDSSGPNGIILSPLDPDETDTYHVSVYFPASAGNEYQNARVVFNLLIGIARADHIVINEVMYDVDPEHGDDCKKDRDIDVNISDNGAGSTNIVNLNFFNTCTVIQRNTSNIRNRVRSYSNTGFNSILGNLGGSFIQTGASNIFVGLFNRFNINIANNSCCCSDSSSQNDEWVEIYNPTNETVNLQNWKLRDNSGNNSEIGVSVELEPGEFALISHSLTTWNLWNEDPGAKKIALGSEIGDGLDNAGDHLYLVNQEDEIIDFTAWGNDTEDWNPAVPGVSEGHSIERLSPGFDTDVPEDWEDRFPPTPGN